MRAINQAVGKSSPNKKEDIATIISLLEKRKKDNYYKTKMASVIIPKISDSDIEQKIMEAIRKFQKNVQGVTPDGVVSPNGNTILFMGGVRNKGKQIIVELDAQNLYAYDNGLRVYKFNCASGSSKHKTAIKPELHHVFRKHEDYTSKTYNAPMDYAMFFTKDGKAIHESRAVGPTSYLKMMGVDYFGSHGCVRLSGSDAKKLFFWSPMRTPVFIDMN